MRPMPYITPQPPTPRGPHRIERQAPESIEDTQLGTDIKQANEWLSSIVDTPGDRNAREAVHKESAKHALELTKHFTSGHALRVLPGDPDNEHTYQMLVLLLMKTAIQNGDVTWASFDQSAHFACITQTFSGLAWLDARRQDMTAAGLSSADQTATWLDCCYNFVRTLTYAAAPAPNGNFPDDSDLQPLIEKAAALHAALKAIDCPEDLSCSIANNEFSYQLLQHISRRDASYLRDDDPLCIGVRRLHATYEGAIGNPRLGDDLARVAEETGVYVPTLSWPAQQTSQLS